MLTETVSIREACRRADIADYQIRYLLSLDRVPGAFKWPTESGRWRIPVSALPVLRQYVTMHE